MSLISRLLNWVRKLFYNPTEQLPPTYTSEKDINLNKTWDDYSHGKRVRDFFFQVIQLVVLSLLLLLGYEIWVNLETRKKIVDLLVENIAGLSYALLTVAGITVSNSKK